MRSWRRTQRLLVMVLAALASTCVRRMNRWRVVKDFYDFLVLIKLVMVVSCEKDLVWEEGGWGGGGHWDGSVSLLCGSPSDCLGRLLLHLLQDCRPPHLGTRQTLISLDCHIIWTNHTHNNYLTNTNIQMSGELAELEFWIEFSNWILYFTRDVPKGTINVHLTCIANWPILIVF